MSEIQAKGSDLSGLRVSNPATAIIQHGMEKGMTVEQMREMFNFYKEMEAEQARKEFASALSAVCASVKEIVATREVKNKQGQTMYRYANLSDLKKEVDPYLKANGLSVSFDTVPDPNRAIVLMRLSHVNGHSETSTYSVKFGNGPPNSSREQADESSYQIAQRCAYKAKFNLGIDKDFQDAREEGDFITEEEAIRLQERVQATNSDEARFLKFAQADTYGEIRRARMSELNQLLKDKEAKKG